MGRASTLYWHIKVSRASKGSKVRAVPASTGRPAVAAPAARQFRWPHAWRILLLWTLVAVPYSDSWRAGLIFDNGPLILDDPRVHQATLHNAGEILTGDYWHTRSVSGLYRPLTTFSYLLNYALLGNGPRRAGYHAINLALHLANVALVYALGMFVFGEIDLAWALAALWGVHPLLTESVTNVVGRADLLMACGVLTGLLCYVRSASQSGRAKAAWLAAMVAAQTVGLFSKESAAVLPAMLLLYDLTFGKFGGWRRRAPAYAALLLPFAAYFSLRSAAHTHLEIIFLQNPLASAGFWTARLTAIKVIGKLAWLFVWPVQLSADYSFNAVPLFGWRLDWEDAKALLALALCLAGALAAAGWRRSHRTASFFIGFFLVAIAPTANLVILIGSIMAERFLYLGSIGLAGCAVAALRLLGRRMSRRGLTARQVVWSATGLICLACAARTYARNLDWRDGRSLWTSAVEVSPAATLAHNNLGQVLMAMGRLPDAIAEFQAALRILPGYPDARFNLGLALMKSGRLSGAMAEFQETLREEPGYVNAHIDLGIALAQIPERVPDAMAEFQAAIRLRPDSAEAHDRLGTLLAEDLGRGPEAIAEYRAALQADPDYAPAHNNLGSVLARLPGRLPDAIAEFQSALRSQPAFAKAHSNLGAALAQMPGRAEEAAAEYQAAARDQPDSAEAHYDLGTALAKMPGREKEALAELETAVRMQPDSAEMHYNLATLLVQVPERYAEAIAEFRAAVRANPNFAPAHNNLGSALGRMQSHAMEAIAEYRAALRLQPDYADAHYNLGVALAQQPGQHAAALAELETAMRLDHNPQTRQALDWLRSQKK
jgi:tetratricopeptide (TPR) repeat protein